jgi:hypothetical protein
MFDDYSKTRRESLSCLKIWQEWLVPHIYMYIYDVDMLFLEWEMFRTKVVLKIKTHLMLSNFFFPKVVPFLDNVEKYGTGRQAIDKIITRRMRF